MVNVKDSLSFYYVEQSDIKNENFEKICRICLNENEVTDIFDLQYDGHCISDLIYFCCSVQVLKNDNYPQNICVNCLDELINVFEFIQKCCSSSESLRLIVERTVTEKSFFDEQLPNFIDDDLQEEIELTLNENTDSFNDEILLQAERKLESDSNENLKNTNLLHFMCQDCDITCDSYDELKLHRKLAKHYIEKNVNCSICGKIFTSNERLKQHMRTHTKEKPYQCELCFACFSLSRNLKRHIMIHTGERPFVCDICGKGFIQQATLIEHKRIHTGETPYICNYCGKTMRRSTELKAHIARHVLEDEEDSHILGNCNDDKSSKLECNICKKLANSKRALRIHKSVAHGRKSQLCSICGKGFVGKQGLVSHLKTHTGEKPYSCHFCQKRFAHRTTLKDHILTHTGEKPHVCKICGRGFIQHHHLVHHMRTHSGERPYSCNFCGKAFALKGNLTVHTRIHTGETPFICSFCDVGFYDSSSLKKHMQSHIKCEPPSD